MVQQRTQEPEFPCAGPHRGDHDPDRGFVDGYGHGEGMGAGNYGSPHGDTCREKGNTLGKAHSLFYAGHGRHGAFGSHVSLSFPVPLTGSLMVLFAAASLFLFAALGMGLLISIMAKNQFVAGQIAIIVTFLPAFILSGFIFDIGSMPLPVQLITHLIAARYFVVDSPDHLSCR